MINRKYNFIKVNPAGNITILFDRQYIADEDIQEISRRAMSNLHISAEQVGFINENHLQMMGGEFCGNASRSFATYLAFKDTAFNGDKVYQITCSGEKALLDVHVRQGEAQHSFLAKIKMPAYTSISEKSFSTNKEESFIAYEVLFTGICHFIVLSDVKDTYLTAIDAYAKENHYEAYGIMFFNEKNYYMTPYVKVEGFEGVWENSCGSGTTATGYFLSHYQNIKKAKITQPGGWLEVSVEGDDIFIDGPVEIICEGTTYMHF